MANVAVAEFCKQKPPNPKSPQFSLFLKRLRSLEQKIKDVEEKIQDLENYDSEDELVQTMHLSS